MHWILEQPPERLDLTPQDYSQITLSEILKEKGICFSFHKIVPIAGELIPPIEENIKNAICIGPYSMRRMAVANNILPGVYDIEKEDFQVQMKHWGNKMLNANSRVLKFGDLDKNNIIEDEIYFMRPINDSKCFAGGIFEGKSILQWREKVIDLKEDYGDNLFDGSLVQINKPIKIHSEYRNWIVDGKIVTSSLYKIGDRVTTSENVPKDILDFVNECISIWQPHSAFVIDVCKIINDDGTEDYKIVEINTLNASGFYKADLNKLIDALENLENNKT